MVPEQRNGADFLHEFLLDEFLELGVSYMWYYGDKKRLVKKNGKMGMNLYRNISAQCFKSGLGGFPGGFLLVGP